MKNLLLFSMGFAFLCAGCANGPKHAKEEDPMTYDTFQSLFTPFDLPYVLSPELLRTRVPDSLAIPAKVIDRFLPDTLLKGVFDKRAKTNYFPLGKTVDPSMTYLVLKVVSSSKMAAFLCLFNKKGKFLRSMLVGQVTNDPKEEVMFLKIDRRYTLTVTQEKKMSPARTILKENVYAAYPDGSLQLIMTNSNEPINPNQITNPIDTLPRRHKFSGDYAAGTMNLVAIRDGKTPKEFEFFIHFNKDNGACTGEVDGTARFTGSNVGEFHDENGPCVIQFHFSTTQVIIKEVGGCGAYRGIKCLIEGSFKKKKEVKTNAVKKRKKVV